MKHQITVIDDSPDSPLAQHDDMRPVTIIRENSAAWKVVPKKPAMPTEKEMEPLYREYINAMDSGYDVLAQHAWERIRSIQWGCEEEVILLADHQRIIGELRAFIKQIREHHVHINDLKGRPVQNSLTIELCDAALKAGE